MSNSLTFALEPDEIELFLQEVDEHIQTLETQLLRLEQGADEETLNTVFRAAHTLKAAAATVGHQRMADLTHALETFFDRVRAGAIAPDRATGDELLLVVDALRTLRNEVVSQETSAVDVAALLARLRARSEESTEIGGEPIAPAAESSWRDLTEEQAARLAERRADGWFIWGIDVEAEPAAFVPEARLIQVTTILAEIGQIIAQQPAPEELLHNQRSRYLRVVLATPTDAAAIAAHLRSIPELGEILVQEYVDPVTAGAPEHAPSAVLFPARRETSAVRISVERLDALMNLVGELVTDRTRLYQIDNTLRLRYGKEESVQTLGETAAHLSRVVDQLQNEVMQARMLPIATLFTKLPRLVRDLARNAGKQVDLVIEGETTQLDRSIIEAIGDPLIHLARNAIDHGIEAPEEREQTGKSPTGTIRITAAHEEGHVVITVQDDGRGLDPTRIRAAAVSRGLMSKEEAGQLDDDSITALIFQPNISTATQVTEVSGRGVGLDIVLTNIKKLGGAVAVDSLVGQGATFRLTLPLTLAILQTMLVGVGEDIYAIPLSGIAETLYLADVKVSYVKRKPVIYWRGQTLPLVYLRQFFAHPRLRSNDNHAGHEAVIVVAWSKLRVGLVADQLIGKQEVVIKSLNGMVGNIAGISGCAILGDGRVILIADIPGIINTTIQKQKEGRG